MGRENPQCPRVSPPYTWESRGSRGRFLSPKPEREAAALMALGSEMRLSSVGTPGLPHSNVPLILKNLPRERLAWSQFQQFPKLHLGSALSYVGNHPH